MSPPTIEVHDLTKTYAGNRVVDRLSFTVAPGRITGFLGPNGAGKSTTMRLMVGLDHPDHGAATFDGRAYRELPRPAAAAGCVFDAGGAHPSRRALDHPRWAAACEPEAIASSSLGAVVREAHSLDPWVGLGVLLGYVVVAVGLGGLLLERREA